MIKMHDNKKAILIKHAECKSQVQICIDPTHKIKVEIFRLVDGRRQDSEALRGRFSWQGFGLMGAKIVRVSKMLTKIFSRKGGAGVAQRRCCILSLFNSFLFAISKTIS